MEHWTGFMTPAHRTSKPILVLSGTGKTGRRVDRLLTDRGLRVRIGSRSALPAFDWADAGTWPAALDGVGAVYVCYQPDLALPGATDAIAAFTAEAVEHDVERLVLLAGRGESFVDAYLADGDQQVLGRPPRDFTSYAVASAATGVWSHVQEGAPA